MRAKWIVVSMAVLLLGAFAGALLAPPPASAIAREIIQLQQQVAQLLQAQQDLRSAVDANNASTKTLLQQALDSISRLDNSMGSLQKAVQDVQANSGSRIDTLATQTQGLSDNLQDVQARVGKLSQQLTDVQNLLQSIDAKVSNTSAGGAIGSGSTSAPSGPPPASADTLYQNGLRDFTSGKYDLSRQEFGDYLRYFPITELASNAQFYLGEIDYAQKNYQDAASEYDKVIVNYPKSFKLAAAMLKKGEALQGLGQNASATRQYREVVRRFPGSDEARRAQARLRELAQRAAPR